MNVDHKTMLMFAQYVNKIAHGVTDEHEILDAVDRSSDELVGTLRKSQDGNYQIIGFHRWAENGFPIITMGHKFCASMLVTNATEEAITLARPPFSSFVIDVPNGMLSINNPPVFGGGMTDIAHLLVVQIANHKVPEGWAWAYTAFAKSGLSIYRFGVRSLELLPAVVEGMLPGDRQQVPNDDPFKFELSDTDLKVSALVGKLIVNTCLAFSDPTNVRTLKPGKTRHKVTSHGPGRAPEPTVRTYVLGKEVRHDFRQEVRDYLEGRRKASPSVQVCVAGHFKMQPHGPRNTLRKLIWREPFWRGPEDAPIPIRPHKV